MIEGPLSAPSSPPDTPVPIKCSPLALSALVRRVESGKCELPPSIRMSPGESNGTNSSITWSTASALTMIMILRGALSAATSSCGDRVPTIFFPLARPSTNASTREVVRLNTATVKPWLSMFRTRFSPITARPTSPMSAVCALDAMLSALTGSSLAGIVSIAQIVPTCVRQFDDPRPAASLCPVQSCFHGGRSGSSLKNRASWASMY